MSVAVVDINDNTPQFEFGVNATRYSAEILESAGPSFILNFVATDEDSTSNGEIAFNFYSELLFHYTQSTLLIVLGGLT